MFSYAFFFLLFLPFLPFLPQAYPERESEHPGTGNQPRAQGLLTYKSLLMSTKQSICKRYELLLLSL